MLLGDCYRLRGQGRQAAAWCSLTPPRLPHRMQVGFPMPPDFRPPDFFNVHAVIYLRCQMTCGMSGRLRALPVAPVTVDVLANVPIDAKIRTVEVGSCMRRMLPRGCRLAQQPGALIVLAAQGTVLRGPPAVWRWSAQLESCAQCSTRGGQRGLKRVSCHGLALPHLFRLFNPQRLPSLTPVQFSHFKIKTKTKTLPLKTRHG